MAKFDLGREAEAAALEVARHNTGKFIDAVRDAVSEAGGSRATAMAVMAVALAEKWGDEYGIKPTRRRDFRSEVTLPMIHMAMTLMDNQSKETP